VYRIYGVGNEYDPGNPDQDIRFYSAGDQEIIAAAFRKAVETGEPYDLELQLDTATGDRIWVRTIGLTERRGDKTLRVFGNIIDITKQKQAEEEIRRANAYNRSLIEASLDPLVTISPEGRISDVNEATVRATGVQREALIGTDFSRYFTEPDRAKAGYETVFREGTMQDYALEIRHADGRVTPVLYNASVFRDEVGMVNGAFAAARDITRTKRAEAAMRTERQRLYDVLETLPVYVCLLDKDYRMPFANRYFRETFGESHGRRCYDFLFNLDKPCETCETYKVMKTKARHHWYWTGPNRRDYDIYDFPFTDSDGSFNILEMGIDITERNRAEAALQKAHDKLEERVEERTAELAQRNEELGALNEELTATQEDLRKNLDELTRTEKDLRESEERYRLVANFTHDWEFWIGPEGDLRYISPSAERILGRPVSGFATLEDLLRSVVHPDDLGGRLAHLALEKTGSGPFEMEYRIVRPDGEVRWIHHVCQPVHDAAGKFLGTRGSNRDNTDRKRAEEAVRESEDRLRFALETTHTGAWDLDLVDHTASRSLEHDRVFGYPDLLPQWTYEMFLSHVIPEDRVIVDGKFRHAIETRGDWDFECRIRRADGGLRWIVAAGRHRAGASGSLSKMAGIVQDITERKRLEDEIQATLQRFYLILSGMNYAILLITDENRVEFANQAFCDFFSLDSKPGELPGKTAGEILEMIRPSYQDPGAAIARIGEIVRRGEPVQGEDVPMSSGRAFLRDFMPIRVGGKLYGRLWVHVDITRRKKAEEALRVSEEKFRSVLDNSPDVLYRFNLRTQEYEYFSPASRSVYGYSPEEMTAMTERENWNRIHTEDHSRFIDEMARIQAAGDGETEIRWMRSSGDYIWISVSIHMAGDADGKPLYRYGFVRDVTRRREAEEELKNKNENLSALNEEITATQEELHRHVEELSRREQELNRALAEKEVLLAEIHHRVKNNLTAFISLLSLEGSIEDTPAGRRLRQDLQNRARSMSLIHETLYRTKLYDEVDMGMYLTTLLDHIGNSFKATGLPVKTVVDAHGVMLDISRATPAGLIVNELVTNSFKYAFSGSRAGKVRADPPSISITLAKNDGEYRMTVADNGPGLPPGFEIAKTQTLGLKLVNFLAVHQMRAKVEVNTENGTEFVFRFPE
jgi:hypothetical protein